MRPLRKTYPRTLRQTRDLALLHLLADEFVLLTRAQIRKLFPERSIRRTNFRLRRLIQAGYLSRRYPAGLFAAQLPLYHIGPRAAEALGFAPDDPKLRLRRTQALHLRDGALPHLLEVNSAHLKFRSADRDYPDYELVNWIPQHAPIWRALNDFGFPLRPDGYAEVRQASQLGRFFIEIDRGSERGTVIPRKLAAYAEYARSGRFQVHFSAPDFRVLFIAPGARRARSLLALMRRTPSDIFAVITSQEFFQSPLLDAHWKCPGSELPHALLISL